MNQDKPLFEVEVQPPTPEEIERQRVRKEYRAKLAEKLKDPEFRKIEGFPIGTDEAILALSDPPYYTACPNPFIEEWLKEHGKPFDPETDDYHREPFAADVSEGKNHPIYNAHSYHTKVPHRAIMRYILHYTEPGDVVYDGFCGTGMTGVAAQLCGKKSEIEALGFKVDSAGNIWELPSWEAKQAVQKGLNTPFPHLTEPKPFSKIGVRFTIQSDLSTVAAFITYNYNTPVNGTMFESEANRVLSAVESQCRWMYSTLHRESGLWSDESWQVEVDKHASAIRSCTSVDAVRNYIEELYSKKLVATISYTVWSDVFQCGNCGNEIVFFGTAVDPISGKVAEEFACPHCGTISTKRALARTLTSFFDFSTQAVVQQSKQVPVEIRYQWNKFKIDKNTDTFDLALIEAIQRFEIPNWFPEQPMMGIGEKWGDSWRAGYHTGITHSHHFYTKRNLWTISAFYRLAMDSPLGIRLLPLLTGGLLGLTKLQRYKPGSYFPNMILSGTLYVGSMIREWTVFHWLSGKIKTFKSALQSSCHSSITGSISATERAIPENSLDYIFVDPPFGGNLMYSELNFLWESWLNVATNNVSEAITNESQGKRIPEYQRLMSVSFENHYAALKPGRWMTVEFHNSANAIWNCIHEAIERSGFIVADVRILDKERYSYKQLTSGGATKQDLVISCYKPSAKFIDAFEADKGTPQGVKEFVEQHLEMLPVTSTTPIGALESLAERTLGVLFDRMIAYHLVRGARIPLSASEFRVLLEELCYERDGMFFLPSQVVRYDALKSRGIEVEQLSIFVRDEKSAVQWVRSELERSPQTLGDLTPKFMQASQDWGKHEVMPELKDLLHQYYIREDDETWVVPNPDNEKHLEEVRRKAMLREFQEYVRRTGQLKLFRTEAVLAGFLHCWETKQYNVIVGVCEKIPSKILQEIQDLVMYYDLAKERAPEKISQFEFKWE
jgi:predicted RNA-binding Zn-ribbon protein involved in translation (DUF1610 family)